MLLTGDAAFIKTFIENLNESLKTLRSDAQLTRLQTQWLSFCLTGILLTNGINWTKFNRCSLGNYTASGLSWMFRHGKIAWNLLLIASVKMILLRHGITEGQLVLDEVDRARSKSTQRIHKSYKQKHKASGGYVNGQTVIVLLLVTSSITIPVGFVFYQPDPMLSAWNKEEAALKKKGVPKSQRPPEPERNPDYPTKLDLALGLLHDFAKNHSGIKVTVIMADALYGEGDFMDKASSIFGGVQTISQLRKNQNIIVGNKKKNLEKYFNATNKGVQQTLTVRGGEQIEVTVSSARLKVDAHGKKRFVIALKYENEEDYRFLVATDMSWRTLDIAQAYTLRWLVEVFFEDWKLYEGWGREARQFDEEGAVRGVILSLLLDHALLLHPEQTARLENKLPAYTVGSLQRLSQVETLLAFIESILQESNPFAKLKELIQLVKEHFQLIP
ncbi:MAG: transposase, partial [Desulfamplus sp.]|nr:transposase [Desulfamplus sp.]